MNSSKIFDDVILYLEKVISDGSEIDYDQISKITFSPFALFSRIFVFVSGVSISEYVRKRRITLAGHDLKNNDISVLDAAVKYGFLSHSAFTRAFKEHHGITPTEAKNTTVKLNDYPPINFFDMRFIGGKRIMAEMKKIVYKQTPARLMAGLHSQTTFHKMGEIWQKFFQSSIAEELQTYKDFSCCDDLEENDGIDLMFNFKDKDNFEVIIGDFFKTDAKLPKNFFTKPIPEGLTAHIQIEGNNVADIVASAYLLITQAIEQTDKQIDYENFYWCEVYTKKRFSEPQKFGGKVTIDYILPIK